MFQHEQVQVQSPGICMHVKSHHRPKRPSTALLEDYHMRVSFMRASKKTTGSILPFTHSTLHLQLRFISTDDLENVME